MLMVCLHYLQVTEVIKGGMNVRMNTHFFEVLQRVLDTMQTSYRYFMIMRGARCVIRDIFLQTRIF